jgi:hypothetical protein
MRFLRISLSVILSGMMALTATFSAEHLAPISNYPLIKSVPEVELDNVIDSIAKALKKDPEKIKTVLNNLKLDPEKIRDISVRRFNLESSFYQQYFSNLWNKPSEKNEPLEHIKEAVAQLSQGYFTKHKLENHGQLILKSLEGLGIPITEIPNGLENIPLYESFAKKHDDISIEWAWRPEIKCWLPTVVQTYQKGKPQGKRTLILRIALDQKNTVVKCGVEFPKSVLENLYQELNVPFKVYSRNSHGGRLQLGLDSKNPPNKRKTGIYSFRKNPDELFFATIEKDSVVTTVNFIGTTPFKLLLAVKIDSSGDKTILESHTFFHSSILKELFETHGPFWIQGGLCVNKQLESSTTAILLHITSEVLDEPGLTLRSAFAIPAAYSEKSAQVLIAESGLPAYYFVEGVDTDNPDIHEFLKRVEIRYWNGTRKSVSTAHHHRISPEYISHALNHATGYQVVATHLDVKHIKKNNRLAVSVGSQTIFISHPIAKRFDLSPKLLAEVVYLPSKNKKSIPIEIRLGNYSHNDPLQFKTREFVPKHSFMLQPDPANNKKFFVLDPDSTQSQEIEAQLHNNISGSSVSSSS